MVQEADQLKKRSIEEKGYTARLVCSQSTKDLIMDNCVKEFRKHHPAFDGVRVSENLILQRIARYYLTDH